MTLYQPLGQGVYHLDTLYIAPGVASFYCVIHDGEIGIIETGTSGSLPQIQTLLSDLSLSPEQVKYVIPTHVHLDHAGGAGAMMRAFPDAQLIIHPRGARHMINPEQLVNASKAVYGEETFTRLYGEIPPIDESRVIQAEHESAFYLGGRELFIVHTPGHAYHHFCVVDLTSGGIFSGDTFGLSYPNLTFNSGRIVIPTTTPTHFNPEALHESIDLLMSFQPRQMYLTHYNVLPDPALVVDQYRSLLDEFVSLTESIKPLEDSGLSELMDGMEQLIIREFQLDPELVKTQLAMDIKLNSQGLAYWYRKRND
jgi:glyoxylase-like metal-dependent hydrolase (beta-lactamase superfamily II)